jgi:sugar phosphate isomerase/epimerase
MKLIHRPSRRTFLELSAKAVAAGVALRPGSTWAATHQKFGVQMYTVRALVGKDLPGLFRAIRAAGYEQVETFPPVYDYPAKELRAMVLDAGLTAPSGHFDYATLASKMGYAQQLGLRYMVCPMLPGEQWNPAGFRKAAADFNKWGAALEERGMQFVFHNLDYEFKPQSDGSTGWNILMGATDPKLVGLEIDCYWAVQAGQDPMQMLTTYRNRIHMLHLKDRTPGAPTSFDNGPSSSHFTDMGKGSIRWKPLLQKARAQGIEYFFLDQDETNDPLMPNLTSTYQYLQSVVS